MTIETRFGSFDASAADIVTLPDGLPGFERCRRFVVVTAPDLAPFTCLQGLDDVRPSFLTLDPRLAAAGYQAPLPAADRLRLGAASQEPLLWLSLVCLDGDRARVNLRAPIVVNPRTMVGLQVIASESVHPIDHPLGVD